MYRPIACTCWSSVGQDTAVEVPPVSGPGGLMELREVRVLGLQLFGDDDDLYFVFGGVNSMGVSTYILRDTGETNAVWEA